MMNATEHRAAYYATVRYRLRYWLAMKLLPEDHWILRPLPEGTFDE